MHFFTGQHFGGLLDSAAANVIVERKIESALAGPEGKLSKRLFLSPTHFVHPPPPPRIIVFLYI